MISRRMMCGSHVNHSFDVGIISFDESLRGSISKDMNSKIFINSIEKPLSLQVS